MINPFHGLGSSKTEYSKWCSSWNLQQSIGEPPPRLKQLSRTQQTTQDSLFFSSHPIPSHQTLVYQHLQGHATSTSPRVNGPTNVMMCNVPWKATNTVRPDRVFVLSGVNIASQSTLEGDDQFFASLTELVGFSPQKAFRRRQKQTKQHSEGTPPFIKK